MMAKFRSKRPIAELHFSAPYHEKKVKKQKKILEMLKKWRRVLNKTFRIEPPF